HCHLARHRRCIRARGAARAKKRAPRQGGPFMSFISSGMRKVWSGRTTRHLAALAAAPFVGAEGTRTRSIGHSHSRKPKGPRGTLMRRLAAVTAPVAALSMMAWTTDALAADSDSAGSQPTASSADTTADTTAAPRAETPEYRDRTVGVFVNPVAFA